MACSTAQLCTHTHTHIYNTHTLTHTLTHTHTHTHMQHTHTSTHALTHTLTHTHTHTHMQHTHTSTHAHTHAHTHTHTHIHRCRTANASCCAASSGISQHLPSPKWRNRHQEAHAPLAHSVPCQFPPLSNGTPRDWAGRLCSHVTKKPTGTHRSRVAY